MTKTNLRTAALAVLALGAGLGTSTAFAQVGYGEPAYGAAPYAQPAGRADQEAVPNTVGHFSCAFNENHTRLERKNCGGSHYNAGF